MARHWTDKYSYVTGVVRLPDLAYVALVEDKLSKERIPHSFFSEWDAGSWRGDGIAKKWDTVSMCICQVPVEQGLALGPKGEIFCVGSGDIHEETVATGSQSPENRGPLRAIRSIGGRAFVVGMDRQAYRRDGRSTWVAIDQGARPDSKNSKTVGFESVDGFGANDIYAVGWDGAIWHYNGTTWTEIASPTNLVLTNVCCAGDGKVYATGRRGLLLCGQGPVWEVVEHESMDDDIWGLAWYRGCLYLATNRSVFVLSRDRRLTRVYFGSDPPRTCFHLSTGAGVLWSIGPKDVMSFDGFVWSRID